MRLERTREYLDLAGGYIDRQAEQRDRREALAELERAEAAIAARLAAGHNDTCDTAKSPDAGYSCNCGHDALAAFGSVERLVELTASPDSLDWETLERVNDEGWGGSGEGDTA